LRDLVVARIEGLQGRQRAVGQFLDVVVADVEVDQGHALDGVDRKYDVGPEVERDQRGAGVVLAQAAHVLDAVPAEIRTLQKLQLVDLVQLFYAVLAHHQRLHQRLLQNHWRQTLD